MNVNPWFVPNGIVTVGTGTGASNGQINASDADCQGDFGKALRNALLLSRYVVVLPGDYTQTTVPDVIGNDITIEGKGNPTITTTSLASTRSLNVLGSRAIVSGVHFTSASFVANSTYVNVTGDEVTIEKCRFTCSASDGSNSTPMWYVTAGTTTLGVFNPQIVRNRFHGAKGVGFVHIAGNPGSGTTTGSGAIVSGNHFGTDKTSTPEKFYCCVWFDSAGEAVVSANRAHGLGDGTDKGYAVILATTVDSESEAQHLVITGNNFELVTSQHGYRGDGARFTVITGNLFGRFGGNGSSEGTIHITDNTGSGAVDGADVVIVGNDFHNASTSSGRIFWLETSDTGLVAHNTFSLVNGTVATIASTAENVTWGPNRYKMSSGTTNILQLSGTYNGLVINEPALPAGCTLTSSQPTAGALVDGILIGVTTPLDGQAGIRQTRTTGAANGATFAVTGLTASDSVMMVTDITNHVVYTASQFARGSGLLTNNTGVDLSGATLIVSWFDA